ncbi:chemotaxis protein CheW [Candidatus Clostridium helianthi]|jgi:Chemotaxis signal transduction protein|uniref:Chemotaxis protein CheW n=1 Tax=Candidatus Clostridium helianthi TaxID=3381660 RepID=A0ABW8S3I2_9CLOT
MLIEKFVVFSIGQEEYAVPISQVKEVIYYTIPTRIPSSMDSVIGVINLRGKILPILNLSKEIGIKSNKEFKEQKIIIIENNNPFGVIVDDVEEVIKLPKENINRIDSIYEGEEYIIGITRVKDRLIIIMDLNLFWEEISG